MSLLLPILIIILAYFLGCLPTGLLIAKARGIDIQKQGSGNIGATNVLRSVGLIPGIIVVIMDPLKGYLAVLAARLLGMEPWVIALTALAVVLGHNYNIFLKFRGGKGIATSLGAYLAIDPLFSLMIALIGIMAIYLGRLVSLGSLVAVFASPFVYIIREGTFEWPYFLLLVAFAGLAFYRHSANIKKLALGTERRIGEKTSKPEAETKERK